MEFCKSAIWFQCKIPVMFFTVTATTACLMVMFILSNLQGQMNMNFVKPARTYQRTSTLNSTANRQILLVAYGRSGSSFTSALIQHHRDVFFAYEPLFVLQEKNQSYGSQNESVKIVTAFLTCHVFNDNIRALENPHLAHSNSTSTFYKCLLSKRKGMSNKSSCYQQLVQSCHRHKVTFVKTIRFKIKWAEPFLENNPNFKLLYLVRDPRATLFSQARVFRKFDWRNNIGNISRRYCTILEDDLNEAERLKQLFPDQVKGIRYEQGALDVFAYTKDIYQFLGLPYDEGTAKFVQELTNASIHSPEIHNAFSVRRHNSSQTMGRWRFNAGFNSVSEIDKNCGHMYSKLGYKYVQSQKDLESTRSLLDKPELGGIFS